MKTAYPFFAFSWDERAEGYGVSEECKNLASSIYCAPCHPLVGTGVKRGVCRESCDAWYSECAPALFEHAVTGLQPCAPSSLICTPLRDIVRDGEQFCRAMGVRVGFSSNAPQSPSASAVTASSPAQLHDAFSAFVTDAQSFHATALVADSDERPYDDGVPCFVASAAPVTIAPSSSTKRPSSSRTTTSASAASESSSWWSPYVPTLSWSAWQVWATKAVRRWYRRVERGGTRSLLFAGAVGTLVAALLWVAVYDAPRVLWYLRRIGWRPRWLRTRITSERVRQQRVARLGQHK